MLAHMEPSLAQSPNALHSAGLESRVPAFVRESATQASSKSEDLQGTLLGLLATPPLGGCLQLRAHQSVSKLAPEFRSTLRLSDEELQYLLDLSEEVRKRLHFSHLLRAGAWKTRLGDFSDQVSHH